VRNTGELAATITEISVKPLTFGIDENGPEHACYGDIEKAKSTVTPKDETAKQILPKRSSEISAVFNLPNQPSASSSESRCHSPTKTL
jgi:hypothetical protein